MLILLLFLVGLSVGSFLNVCIDRLPLKQSLVQPRSYCMACKEQLPVQDIIPVISFLLLRRRCRFCAALLSWRYIGVELLTGCLFIWCYFILGVTVAYSKALILTSFLICITFIDLRHQLILDKMLVLFASVAVSINLFDPVLSCGDMISAAVAGGGIFLVIAIITRGGMGGGDIKFVAALGLWLGFKLTMLTVFLAFLLGGLGGLWLIIAGLKKRKDFIPFGPFIAVSAWISLLYGEQLIIWYLS